jgi:hypothetical protein
MRASFVDGKPKVNPADTYLLDDEDIDELDELTLTSVIRDASEIPDPEPLEDTPAGIDDLEFDILSPDD